VNIGPEEVSSEERTVRYMMTNNLYRNSSDLIVIELGKPIIGP